MSTESPTPRTPEEQAKLDELMTKPRETGVITQDQFDALVGEMAAQRGVTSVPLSEVVAQLTRAPESEDGNITL